MTQIVPIEVYDKDGGMTRIEVYDMAGSHVLDVEWDPDDAQTSENRISFRQWAYRMLEQKGYEVPR